MIIRFNEHFNLHAADVYTYFETPADWPRLFGLAGDSNDLGDGWYSISLKHFPFPLVAKNTSQEPNEMVRWVFRGFWRGSGEVRFVERDDGVTVEGFEEVAVRPLFSLSPVVERLFIERSFRAIWEIGWHRLRKVEVPRSGSGEASWL